MWNSFHSSLLTFSFTWIIWIVASKSFVRWGFLFEVFFQGGQGGAGVGSSMALVWWVLAPPWV